MSDPASESRHSVDSMMVLLQEELRRIAAERLAGEAPGHTLQPTAIINEAYMRLIDQWNLSNTTRSQFLAAAARTIQRILVDHARAKLAEKRGGDRLKLSIDSLELATDDTEMDMAALNDALDKLRNEDERVHQVVQMRFFSGMTVDEIAEALEVSPRTIADDWAFARAWLQRELAD